MREATRRNLVSLEEQGRLAFSAIGDPAREEMLPLLESGVLGIVRSGSGRALQVINFSALRAFMQVHFPEGEAMAELPSRAAALRTLRNTKQARTKESAVLLLRALNPMSCTINSQAVDVCALTQTCGIVGVVLDGRREVSMRGKIALIENQECFLHAERMRLDVDAAIYTAGRLSGLALQFLADSSMQGCEYLHCPDYDPVGMGEFLRYRQVLQDRITLHVPDNLKELLLRYGKPALLQGRNSQLMQTLRRDSSADIVRILQWMDEANAGLEQEILIQ